MHNKHCVHLGLFTNEAEAGRAYDRKALELFGREFTVLNFTATPSQVIIQI